jgi:protein-disulfide isomerase
MSPDRPETTDDRPTRRAGVSGRAILVATLLAVALAATMIGLSLTQASPGGGASEGIGTTLADGTSVGAPDAPVTIDMFSEFQCSVCQAFANTNEKQLRAAYVDTGKVRLNYKHFVIFGDESMQAALASEAAAEQNKFWEFYDVVMAARPSAKTEGDLTTADLQMYAQQIGLDMDAFNDSFLSGRYRERVDQDFADGVARELRGTPTFFINGEKVEGNVPFEKLAARIDALLGEGASE